MRRSDRQITIVLLCAIVVALIVIALAPSATTTMSQGSSATADSTQTGDRRDRSGAAGNGPYYRQEERVAERFPFDPNTADSTQLLRLGLQPWQVRNIYKYRAAGGIYRQKEDFAQLYGLTVGQYRELEPYITIGSDYQPASTLFANRRAARDSQRVRRDSLYAGRRDSLALLYPKKMAEGEHIDLNVMDTTAYRTVPGIGYYYAGKIVAYGRRLGGYTSVDQLDEIEDFPLEAKSFFVVKTPAELRKIYVNRQSLSELKRHPYINYYQAKAITDYRRQSGPIHDLDELRLLNEFPPEAIARLRPYVSYDL